MAFWGSILWVFCLPSCSCWLDIRDTINILVPTLGNSSYIFPFFNRKRFIIHFCPKMTQQFSLKGEGGWRNHFIKKNTLQTNLSFTSFLQNISFSSKVLWFFHDWVLRRNCLLCSWFWKLWEAFISKYSTRMLKHVLYKNLKSQIKNSWLSFKYQVF